MRRSVWAAGTMMAAMAGVAAAQPATTPTPATAPPASAPPRPAAHATFYEMDLIQTGPLTPEFLAKLRPLTTVAEVEALLKANNITYERRHSIVAAERLGPRMVEMLEKLPPNEVFAAPRPNHAGMTIGVILARQ